MFAYIAVEAQRLVVASFAHALQLQEVNGKNRCVMKIAPHPFPNRNDFRIVCDSSQPDYFAHGVLCSCQKSGIPNSDFPMNSRRTSPVGAMTAPACASLNGRSMIKCFEN